MKTLLLILFIAIINTPASAFKVKDFSLSFSDWKAVKGINGFKTGQGNYDRFTSLRYYFSAIDEGTGLELAFDIPYMQSSHADIGASDTIGRSGFVDFTTAIKWMVGNYGIKGELSLPSNYNPLDNAWLGSGSARIKIAAILQGNFFSNSAYYGFDIGGCYYLSDGITAKGGKELSFNGSVSYYRGFHSISVGVNTLYKRVNYADIKLSTENKKIFGETAKDAFVSPGITYRFAYNKIYEASISYNRTVWGYYSAPDSWGAGPFNQSLANSFNLTLTYYFNYEPNRN